MKNLILAILIGLSVYLLLDKVGIIGEHSVKVNDTVTVRDTVWHETNKTIVKEIKQVGGDKGLIPPNNDTFIVSKNYDSLVIRFNALVKELTARRFYKDSLKLDSIGWVVVKDTVYLNTLQKRSYNYSYKTPTITEKVTITNYAPTVNQVYIGGGVSTASAQAGIFLKTKKDLMFGVYVSPSLTQNNIQYGFQTYWKIKLRK